MELKYSKEVYEHSGIVADGDEYMSHVTKKVLKTRKEHNCCLCQSKIDKGNYALREKAIVEDIGWGSCYVCIPCIEKWLVESGQV